MNFSTTRAIHLMKEEKDVTIDAAADENNDDDVMTSGTKSASEEYLSRWLEDPSFQLLFVFSLFLPGLAIYRFVSLFPIVVVRLESLAWISIV